MSTSRERRTMLAWHSALSSILDSRISMSSTMPVLSVAPRAWSRSLSGMWCYSLILHLLGLGSSPKLLDRLSMQASFSMAHMPHRAWSCHQSWAISLCSENRTQIALRNMAMTGLISRTSPCRTATKGRREWSRNPRSTANPPHMPCHLLECESSLIHTLA